MVNKGLNEWDEKCPSQLLCKDKSLNQRFLQHAEGFYALSEIT